ncbi:MAG: ECF transporter S component [Anaeroplasmataceae bacterium]
METIEKKSTLRVLIGAIIALVLGLGLIITAYVLNFNKATFASSPAYIYAMYIIGAIGLLAGACNLYYYLQNVFNIKKLTVKQMTVISIFAGLSVILYYFAKFNLPFFPSWLDVQFSDVPALIVSFMYGPLSGGLIIVLRFFVKLPATMTVGVGELADLLIGLTLTTTAGLLYKRNHSLKGAIFSMVIGMLLATFVAIIANYAILIPAYMKIAKFSMSMLVGGMKYISGINENNFMTYYLFVGVLPFNLFRYLLVFIITFLLYKRLHIFIDHITGENKKDNQISE